MSQADSKPPGGIHVLHVLPFDQARGAQRYARSLVTHLGGGPDRHSIVTLFKGGSGVLEADFRLEVPRGWMRRAGLDIRVVRRLRRLLGEMGPDLMLAHGGESAKYAAMAMPRQMPLIYLKIGSEHPKLSRFASSMMHRMYTRRSDVIVAVSEGLAAEIQEREGLEPGRVEVIPNGRDPDQYRPSDHPRRPGPARLLWVGQLDATKRPDLFVDLVSRLNEAGVGVEASIVGDGPKREEIRAHAQAAGVALLGTRGDVPALLADSDVLVFTGEPPEGMPGVFIEAGLCGLPVVTTRVPGAEDVVEQGVTGLIVDVGDLAGLEEAVSRLVGDREALASMGDRARLRCLERFSLDVTASRWNALFARLLATE
jgi:glycosyltransferase involved in cell wall biosynthesis